MRYHFRTLGHLSLHRGSFREDAVLRDSKSLAVLAYVATAPGREARRSHLADLLWPSSDPKRARRSLRQALYYLSQKADDGLVLSDDGVLGVDPRRLEVDLWRFDQAMEEGDWERAVELYDGPFLDGFVVQGGREFEGWLEAQNERVWSGLKAAYYRLVREAVEADDIQRAARHARAYVELNPLDEKAQRTLIRAHLAAGDRVGAYRAYERYRTLLKEELGVEPGPELEERVGELRDRLFAAPASEVSDAATAEKGVETRAGARGAGDGSPGAGREASDAGSSIESPEPAPGSSESDPGGGSSSFRAPSADGDGRGRGTPSRVAPGVVVRWLSAGVAAGLALGLVVWAAALEGGRAGAEGHTWLGATGRLVARVEGGREVVLQVQDGRVEASRTRSRRHVVSARGDGRGLLRIRTAGGTDVVMVGRAGDTLPVATSGADEGVLGWGPAGRRALLWRGAPTQDNRSFTVRPLLLDTASGRLRALATPNLGTPVQAAWSPLGPQIALRAEAGSDRGDIYRVDVDGTDLVRLTRDPAEDRDPAWSTDGRRIAFVSTRGGNEDLFVMDARGAALERVTFGRSTDRSPVWLSPHHLAFVSDREGERDIWLVDLQTRTLRRLTRRGGLIHLRALHVPAREPPVGRLRIAPRPGLVSPGEHLYLTGELRDAEGDPVPPELASLSWSTTDGSVLRLGPGGRGRVMGAGEARLVASAGGWVSDTLRVSSRPLVPRSTVALMEEDWDDGLATRRWVEFGQPSPFVADRRPTAGSPDDAAANSGEDGRGSATGTAAARPARPGDRRPPDLPRRVFVNNGDANYASGVVSRRAYPVDEGLSLEFQARLPLTEVMYQALKVGLARGIPERNAPQWPEMKDGLLFVVGGGDRSHFRLHGDDGERVQIPAVPGVGGWHTYTLQVAPDGRVSLCVDGRMWWRSVEPAAPSLANDDLHVLLAGRSVGTRLEVGRIQLWKGLRYGHRSGAGDLAARLEGGWGAARVGAGPLRDRSRERRDSLRSPGAPSGAAPGGRGPRRMRR